jgi:hypothetical protein
LYGYPMVMALKKKKTPYFQTIELWKEPPERSRGKPPFGIRPGFRSCFAICYDVYAS